MPSVLTQPQETDHCPGNQCDCTDITSFVVVVLFLREILVWYKVKKAFGIQGCMQKGKGMLKRKVRKI